MISVNDNNIWTHTVRAHQRVSSQLLQTHFDNMSCDVKKNVSNWKFGELFKDNTIIIPESPDCAQTLLVLRLINRLPLRYVYVNGTTSVFRYDLLRDLEKHMSSLFETQQTQRTQQSTASLVANDSSVANSSQQTEEADLVGPPTNDPHA